MLRGQGVAAALDIHRRLAVRIGIRGLDRARVLVIIRREGDRRALDRQAQIVHHRGGQRIGGHIVDAQHRVLAARHHKGEIRIGRAVLAELRHSRAVERDLVALHAVLPVLFECLIARTDIAERCPVCGVQGNGQVGIAARVLVGVKVRFRRQNLVDRRAVLDGQRAGQRRAAAEDKADRVAAAASVLQRLAAQRDAAGVVVIGVVRAALEHRAADLDRVERRIRRHGQRHGLVRVVGRAVVFVKGDLVRGDRALRSRAADHDADRSLGAVLKDQLRRVGARRQGDQIRLVQADAVFIAQQVVIRALPQRIAVYSDADQIVFVRVEGEFIGMGDRVLVVRVHREDGRGDRNIGGGVDRLAGDHSRYAAR